MEQVCADEGEILAAEFIGGCSARLGEVVDTAPHLIDPPLHAAIRRVPRHAAPTASRACCGAGCSTARRLRQFFQRYDLLLTPTTPCTAWDIERGLPPGHENAIVWSYFTYPFNLTGQPAGSLPCGLSADRVAHRPADRCAGRLRGAAGERHARGRDGAGQTLSSADRSSLSVPTVGADVCGSRFSVRSPNGQPDRCRMAT